MPLTSKIKERARVKALNLSNQLTSLQTIKPPMKSKKEVVGKWLKKLLPKQRRRLVV
jgi:hypothetical protein